MGDGGALSICSSLGPQSTCRDFDTVEQAYMLMPWRLLLRLNVLGGKSF